MPGLSSDELAAEKRQQQINHIQNYFSQLARVQNVAHRVLVANRNECKDNVSAKLGFVAITPDDLPKRYKAAAIEALGLSRDTLTIVSAVEKGPGAKGGILAGDELIAVDGTAVPAEDSSNWLATHLRKAGARPVEIEIRRSGTQRTHVIHPVIGCSIPVFLETDDAVNAATDGRRIVVYTGMLRVARTDAELAAVIGHELAHVTMGHLTKMEQNKAAGTVGGLVVDIGFALLGVNTGGAFTRGFGKAGAQAYATDFEREADYVGTYYLAHAGYEAAASEGLWRAMAQENPQNIFYAGIHPASPERFLQMQKTVQEIERKTRAGLPLMPELKKPAVVTTDTTAVSVDR